MTWALLLGCCAGIMLLISPELAAQCQMCRTALTQSAEGQRWSRGINAGIFLLLAAPFLIAGSGLAVIYRAQVLRTLRGVRARIFAPAASRKAELAVPPLSNR
jgi:hypothetical protein